MEKNYYEILEIDKNASQEIIEKAYKTLIKKYHPDLQNDSNKIPYENKLKKINEAYEILSNPEKRNNYNLILKNNNISKDDYNKLYNNYIQLKNELNYIKNNNSNILNKNNENKSNSDNSQNIENEINSKINSAVNQAYYDAYIKDLKNRGYKIKTKKTLKDFIAFIITFILLFILGIIIWHIPVTKNYLINLYNNNYIIKFLVDLILNIFK